MNSEQLKKSTWLENRRVCLYLGVGEGGKGEGTTGEARSQCEQSCAGCTRCFEHLCRHLGRYLGLYKQILLHTGLPSPALVGWWWFGALSHLHSYTYLRIPEQSGHLPTNSEPGGSKAFVCHLRGSHVPPCRELSWLGEVPLFAQKM